LVWVSRDRIVHSDSDVFLVFRIVVNLAVIGFAAPVAWLAFRMKQVAIGDGTLHVSNFGRQIAVPLRDVDGVDQVGGFGARVVVRFATDTTFGRRIVFSPPGSTHPNPHPVVTELRAAIAAANSASSRGPS